MLHESDECSRRTIHLFLADLAEREPRLIRRIEELQAQCGVTRRSRRTDVKPRTLLFELLQILDRVCPRISEQAIQPIPTIGDDPCVYGTDISHKQPAILLREPQKQHLGVERLRQRAVS